MKKTFPRRAVIATARLLMDSRAQPSGLAAIRASPFSTKRLIDLAKF
jgi:hypothetical protein